jgi:type III restriction enzyme
VLRETERLLPVFDPNHKTRSTGNMPTWWTAKHREPLAKSHISHCVYDSAWEATEAYRLEKNPHVTAFAKNDHLGFGILYTFEGIPHYYSRFSGKAGQGQNLGAGNKGPGQPSGSGKTRRPG